MNEMPMIPLQRLTPEELEIAAPIVGSDGRLRASRPQKALGDSQYVWRMVAFFTSPRETHQCMPVMAPCYLGGDLDESEARAKELDLLVDKIVHQMPFKEWKGVHAWMRVV